MGRKKLEPVASVVPENTELFCSLCKSPTNTLVKDSIEYFTYKNQDDDKITIAFRFEILDDRKNKIGLCQTCIKEKKTKILEEFCKG